MDGLLLFTLREKEAFFKDSGKTVKLNKRTEQLLNDNFQFNISCLNEGKFFYVRAICSASSFVVLATERKITNYALL